MKTIAMVAALAVTVQSGPPESFLDARIGDYSKGPKTFLHDMTIGEMMRLTALPEARLREARCAGLARWNAKKGKGMDPVKLARFRDGVAAAVAHDAQLSPTLAAGFVDGFAEDLDYREEGASAAQHADKIAAKQAECVTLLAMAASDAPLSLHPLNNASVVSPALATCYALYTIAAENSEGEEAAGLRKQATRASDLALTGKDAAARTAASAALEAELAAARKNPVAEGEREMMRLVTCLPLMSQAEKAE